MNNKIVWFTPDSFDGERSLSQHCFQNTTYKRKWTGKEYTAAKSLCGKISVSDDGGTRLPVEVIEAEEFNQEKSCKACKKRFEKGDNNGVKTK